MSLGGVRAVYHDGLSSRAREVTLWFLPDGKLLVEGEGTEPLEFPRAAVRVESRLGRAPRFVRLSEERRCEVAAEDHDALDAALREWGRVGREARASAWLHRVEQSWRLVLAAVIALIVIAWLAFAYGVPWAAKQAAFMLPAAVTNKLGDETMAAFDRLVFEPTTLSEERRSALRSRFAEFLVAAGEPADRRVEFRASPRTGPNAFALPSGVIVITDELVNLAERDEQIVAVLAHESGHVRHRHILRGVLQHAAVAAVTTLVTGDVSSTAAAAAGAPGFLLQSRFSRDFEREADAEAVAALRRAGLDPEHLATMLERLERHHRPKAEGEDGGDKGEDKSGALDYVSSHPPTRERLDAIRRAAREEQAPATP